MGKDQRIILFIFALIFILITFNHLAERKYTGEQVRSSKITFCGNNVREGNEQCDGTDNQLCRGDCIPPGQPKACTCAQETFVTEKAGSILGSEGVAANAARTRVYSPDAYGGIAVFDISGTRFQYIGVIDLRTISSVMKGAVVAHNKLYVAGSGSSGGNDYLDARVLVIDITSDPGTLLKQLYFGARTPASELGDVVYSSLKDRIYAVFGTSQNLLVVNPATDTTTTLFIGSDYYYLALSPAEERLYAVRVRRNTQDREMMTIIDTNTLQVLRDNIALDQNPSSILLSQVATDLDGNVYVSYIDNDAGATIIKQFDRDGNEITSYSLPLNYGGLALQGDYFVTGRSVYDIRTKEQLYAISQPVSLYYAKFIDKTEYITNYGDRHLYRVRGFF